MTTERGTYETPKLTEIGSIREVTRADHIGFGQDGFLFFSAGTPTKTSGS